MLKNYYKKQFQERAARGVIVLDKQSGVTSHDEVDRLRSIFRTPKVGHSGTLDPKVTGILVCGLGKGTKVLEYILLSQKIYDCEIIFHKKITKQQFETVLKKFIGTIVQLPPVKSSVKRVERERNVYQIELNSFASDGRSARITCAVERGTYIRKLCHDIGIELVIGAHMGHLRRTTAGPFSLSNSKPIQSKRLELWKQRSEWSLIGWWYTRKIILYIKPIECALVGIPKITVDNRLDGPIRSGADLFAPGVLDAEQCQKGEMVQIIGQNNNVLAIGSAAMDGKLMTQSTSGIAVYINKVLCG